MNDKPSADEKPKHRVAKEVVAQKRRYFVPAHSRGDIEADSPQDAVKKSLKMNKSEATEEDGDV